MQLILLSKERGHLGQVRLDSSRAWLGVLSVALVVCGVVFYGGFKAAALFGISNPQAQVESWRVELSQQQSIVDSTRRALQQNLEDGALALTREQGGPGRKLLDHLLLAVDLERRNNRVRRDQIGEQHGFRGPNFGRLAQAGAKGRGP